MQCTVCGNELSAGDDYCSRCGAATPKAIANSGTSPSELTSMSSPYDAPLQAPISTPPPPSTDYGSSPYGSSQQAFNQFPASYDAYDPYAAPIAPPPPPPASQLEATQLPQTPRPLSHEKLSLPPRRRRARLGLIVGIVVLVLVIIGAGVYAGFAHTAKSSPQVKNPYSPNSGTLVLNDPLSNNSMGYNWLEASDSSGSCGFTGGAYHVTTGAGHFYPCIASGTDYSNFAYEVQMKIIEGACGALLFRIDASTTKYYFFRVCQDGSYALFIYNPTGSNLLSSPSSAAIHTGLNASNLVAVVAQGSTFDFYINHQEVDNITDITYSHGSIGVVADGFPDNSPAEVVYSNAKVWKL